MDHVSTQLPCAVVAAAVSFVAYLIAGFVPNVLIMLPAAILLMGAVLVVIRMAYGKKER